jgi:hypothetical protein
MLRGDGFQFRRGVSTDKQGLSAGLNGGLGFRIHVVFLHPAFWPNSFVLEQF